MYAYDANESFGSWWVKGAGMPTTPIWRPKVHGWTKRERERMMDFYYHPIGELLAFLARVQDPREQRLIQYVYEHKRLALERPTPRRG